MEEFKVCRRRCITLNHKQGNMNEHQLRRFFRVQQDSFQGFAVGHIGPCPIKPSHAHCMFMCGFHRKGLQVFVTISSPFVTCRCN